MSVPFTKIKTELSLQDSMPFGQYTGTNIAYLCQVEPKYLEWCFKSNTGRFAGEVYDYLDDLKMVEKVVKPEAQRDATGQYIYRNPELDDWFDDIPF